MRIVRLRLLLPVLLSFASLICVSGWNAASAAGRSLTTSSLLRSSNSNDPSVTLHCGLFLSSFSDGLLPNLDAQAWLRRHLVRSILRDEQRSVEKALADSAVQSPCCGPDVDTLSALEAIDEAMEQLSCLPTEATLRLLYIPTAMYALRPDSDNTPGKQRQRARADGKKRRNAIVQLLQELLPGTTVETVTLDLDDGSLKQGEGVIPVDATAALTTWQPNMIYVDGGNTFWLHHCMEKGGYCSLLRDLCCGERHVVYCGSSAGAILAGASMEPATWKGWDDPRVVPSRSSYEDWKGVEGLRLAGDVSFFPHMEDRWTELVEEKQASLDSPVLCIPDHAAVVVSADQPEPTFLYAPLPVAAA